MIEATGDLWDYLGTSIIAITTNGSFSRRTGNAVMGKGCAAQAVERFAEISLTLGRLLETQGNHVFELGNGLVSFPVEHTPYENPDLRLIECSAKELRALADQNGWQKVVVPRPGCGGGGLSWQDVRPLLEPYLDDRFILISKEA